MEQGKRLITVDEIYSNLAEHRVPPGGGNRSLPVPFRMAGAIYLKVLCFREGPLEGQELVYPPHYIATIDATTGEIVESKSCVPQDFGIEQNPKVPVDGYGLDGVTVDQFWERMERAQDISHTVWDIYETGSTKLGDASRDLIREYDLCFRSTIKAPLLPYYRAIAQDFLDWVAKIVA